MGGVWFPPKQPALLSIRSPHAHLLQHPCLWREQFPPELTKQLATFENPRGTITNSDLELTGSIVHDNILAQAVPVAHVST